MVQVHPMPLRYIQKNKPGRIMLGHRPGIFHRKRFFSKENTGSLTLHSVRWKLQLNQQKFNLINLTFLFTLFLSLVSVMRVIHQAPSCYDFLLRNFQKHLQCYLKVITSGLTFFASLTKIQYTLMVKFTSPGVFWFASLSSLKGNIVFLSQSSTVTSLVLDLEEPKLHGNSVYCQSVTFNYKL